MPTDQRGVTRPQGSACDIGAYEALAPAALAYYRFENGTAGAAATAAGSILDSTGTTANNGSPSGSPTYSSNVPVTTVPLTGGANTVSLQFMGNQIVTFGSQFPLNTLTNATLEFWFNPANTSQQDIFWTRTDSTDANRFNMEYGSSGNLCFDYRSPSGVLHSLVSPCFPVAAGVWTHVAFVKTGNVWTAYKNGILQSTVTDASPDLPNNTGWTLSGRTSPFIPFNGLIDEIRITDSALAPPQFLNAGTVLQPTIGLNPTSLNFTATQSGSNPANQTVSISNTGTGTLSWTATKTSGGSWLSFTPASGTAPSTLTVSVNISGLTAGTYDGSIEVAATGATNTPQNIPVTLTVSAGSPSISLNTTSLTFAAPSGGPQPGPQTISISNIGGGTLSWTATANTSNGGIWLNISPPSGTAPSALTVSVDTSGLSGGTYNGSIQIAASGATNTPQSIAVTVNVSVAPLTTGLMGHWAMDEPSGSTTAADSSGSGNTATCSGSSCPTFGVSGRIAMAATFDGSNDYLTVNNTVPNSFTIAAWIKTTSVGSNWAGGQGYGGSGIIYSDVPGGGIDMIPMALVGDRLAFHTGAAAGCTPGNFTLTSTVAVNTGQWVHVAVTRNMATGLKQLYINGVLNATASDGGDCPLTGNPKIIFGGNTVDGQFFNGQLDDVYFFDRVLAANEIQTLGAPSAPSTVCAPGIPAPISGSTGAQGVLDPTNTDPSRGLVWPSDAVAAFINMSSGEVYFSSSLASFVQTGDTAVLPGTSSPAFPDGKLNLTSLHLPAGKAVFFKTDSLGLPPPVMVLSCQDVILDSGSILGLGGVFYGSDFPHQLPGSFLGGHALNTAGNVAAGFGPRVGSVPAAGSLYPPVGGGGGAGGTLGGAGGSAVQGGMGGEAIVIAAAQRITVNGEILANGSDAEDAPAGTSGTQGGAGGSVRLAALLVEGTGTINTSAGDDSDGVVRSPNGPLEIQAFLQDLFNGTTTTVPVRGNAPVQPIPTNLPVISIDVVNLSGVSTNTGSLITPDAILPAPSTTQVDVEVTISTANVPDETALEIRAVGNDGSSRSTTALVAGGAATATLTLNAGTTYQIVVTPTTPIPLLRSPNFTVLASARERTGRSNFSVPLHNLAREREISRRRLVEQWMKAFGITDDLEERVATNAASSK